MSRIERGELAPDFTAATYDGKTISSRDYRDSKLWLSFYRFAACPLCNYRIQEVVARYDDLSQAGIRVVCVMMSPPERIAEYAAKSKPPFPIVADPERVMYEAYGVTPSFWGAFSMSNLTTFIKSMRSGTRMGPTDGPMTMLPADFLIDPEGVVYEAFYGKSFAEHIPFESVSAFAADDCLSMPVAS